MPYIYGSTWKQASRTILRKQNPLYRAKCFSSLCPLQPNPTRQFGEKQNNIELSQTVNLSEV